MRTVHHKAATALLVTLLGGEACAGSTRRVLLVEHHAAECVGVGLQLCLLVRQPTESHFSYHHGGIEGFTYEWGFRYQIEVEEHQVSELAADASSIRTVLRRIATKEPVDPATQFFLVLTAGENRVVEIAPDRYRFYGTAEFVCPAGVPCAELRDEIASGARIRYRFQHPETPGDPLRVVEWDVCDSDLAGSQTCGP